MPVPKEQPPRKLSGPKDRFDITGLWREPGSDRDAEGIAISGKRTEGASPRIQVGMRENGAGVISHHLGQ